MVKMRRFINPPMFRIQLAQNCCMVYAGCTWNLFNFCFQILILHLILIIWKSPFVFLLWFSGHLCFADQIGLTPEEVISKIMANPDVALAFQNPRVQQAIMEVYCNWLTINFMKSNHLCNILAHFAVFTEPTKHCQISEWQGGITFLFLYQTCFINYRKLFVAVITLLIY